MRSEKVQFNTLMEQSLCNVYRKEAFKTLDATWNSVHKDQVHLDCACNFSDAVEFRLSVNAAYAPRAVVEL